MVQNDRYLKKFCIQRLESNRIMFSMVEKCKSLRVIIRYSPNIDHPTQLKCLRFLYTTCGFTKRLHHFLHDGEQEPWTSYFMDQKDLNLYQMKLCWHDVRNKIIFIINTQFENLELRQFPKFVIQFSYETFDKWKYKNAFLDNLYVKLSFWKGA